MNVQQQYLFYWVKLNVKFIMFCFLHHTSNEKALKAEGQIWSVKVVFLFELTFWLFLVSLQDTIKDPNAPWKRQSPSLDISH